MDLKEVLSRQISEPQPVGVAVTLVLDPHTTSREHWPEWANVPEVEGIAPGHLACILGGEIVIVEGTMAQVETMLAEIIEARGGFSFPDGMTAEDAERIGAA